MKKPPFSGLLARTLVDSMEVRPEAAYLYDAVMLYVEAVNNLSKKQYDYRNGDLIISQLIGRTYNSAMGFKVYMDMNGDAEGKTKNKTLKEDLILQLQGITLFYTRTSVMASPVWFLSGGFI